jgi:hypothetical protein
MPVTRLILELLAYPSHIRIPCLVYKPVPDGDLWQRRYARSDTVSKSFSIISRIDIFEFPANFKTQQQVQRQFPTHVCLPKPLNNETHVWKQRQNCSLFENALIWLIPKSSLQNHRSCWTVNSNKTVWKSTIYQFTHRIRKVWEFTSGNWKSIPN